MSYDNRHGDLLFGRVLCAGPHRLLELLRWQGVKHLPSASYITALFRIEREVAEASPQKRQQVRQVKFKPLVHQFFLWCDAEAERVLDHGCSLPMNQMNWSKQLSCLRALNQALTGP